MKHFNLSVVLATLFVTTAVPSGWTVSLSRDDSPVDCVFRAIGDTRFLEIAVPKSGFDGAPRCPLVPTLRLFNQRGGVPSQEGDFDKSWLSVKIVDKRHLENGGTRAVLQVDQVDSEGEAQEDGHQLYFCYVDVGLDGPRIAQNVRDDGVEWPDGVRSVVPFPLSCTRPPALVPWNLEKRDGYFNKQLGTGAVFQWQEVNAVEGINRRVEATVFATPDPRVADGAKAPLYFDPPTRRLGHRADDGAIKVVVLLKEKQAWKKSTDWLWQSMERFDEDGNLTMRCRQVRLKDSYRR